MATNFPTSLDALINPQPNNTLDSPSHSTHHTHLNDCIEALEAKVGVNSSSVATSHDKILTLKANIASPSFTGPVVSAGTVTAPTFVGALTGNATTVTTVPALTGDVTTTGSTNVTTISNSAVGNAQLGASSVTSGKIDNAAVLGRKINKDMNSFNGATYTVQDSDYILTHYGSTITYVTLPNASSYTGRPLLFRQIGSAGVISDATNVIPKSSTSPSSGNIGRLYGPVIVTQTQGTWAELVSNGTNWVIVASDENIA